MPNTSSARPAAGTLNHGRRPAGGVTLNQVSDPASGPLKTTVTPVPVMARDPLHGKIPCVYDGNYAGGQFLSDFTAFWIANDGHPTMLRVLPRIAYFLTYCQGDKVDKWKQNWTDRIGRVWNQKKPASEGDLEYLWALFLKDFGHVFARNRKSTPRPPSAKTGMRTSEAVKPKTDAPHQRRDRAEKGGSLSAEARDRIYQMAASTQPLPTPPARPPAPPSAPVPPVASVPVPAPPPAGPTPSWPGPITFSNPVMPDSAWTGPITFARVIQMKRGRCFNCNKKGHVMRTCHAAGQAAIKTTSTQGSRKKKSPALDPTPPLSSGAGTSTTRPASANAKAGPSTITGKHGDPLFTPANLATLESDTLPPLDWLKPFFTEAQLDDYRDGETTPVAFQRTLHGILKARVERKLRRRSPVESGDSRPEGGLMLRIPTADVTGRGPEDPPSRAETPDGLDAASGILRSAREIFRHGLDS
ncbi:hypothetical protein EDB89DRAFT_1905634 [Lactarius sanguifluus]|nr:hypothetical protein EDB89DRAFT_1905634 [Lactarius sanguifluus]